MTPTREDMIRERAHAIWDREGRPEGRQVQHWQQASEEIDREAVGLVAGITDLDSQAVASGGDGLASGLQPGGTIPAGSLGTSTGSLGTSGGQTGGNPTGSLQNQDG